MSKYLTGRELSSVWVDTVESLTTEPGGTATNVMVVVAAPQDGAEARVTAVVDETLRSHGKHGVLSVANTLFPLALYNDPGFAWAPGLPGEAVGQLDSAAAELYAAYLDSLPTLQRVPANRGGTYFSRMIAWPGKTSTGTNQLERRIRALRSDHAQGRSASNASDITVDGEADGAGGSLDEYVVSDTRTRGFPCLVHIDISVRQGKLSLLAVYRHWHLITRGYGNLIGLVRLQEFLCQQTGYEIGELAVVAGHANAEHSDYGGGRGVATILASAREALDSDDLLMDSA